MHFEPPQTRLDSLKEFAKHYFMIVLSILTALALEQAIERTHYSHMAAEAKKQIIEELSANQKEVHEAKAGNMQRYLQLKDASASIITDLHNKMPLAQLRTKIQEIVKQNLLNGYMIPTLRHESWDVAVANQAASHLDPATLLAFSTTYAVQRESATIASQDRASLLAGSHLIDVATDIELDRVDPTEFVRVLRQMMATIGSVQANLDSIEKQIKSVVTDPVAAKSNQ